MAVQTLTERVFKLGPPGGLFDDSVVRTLFPDASAGARKLLVHRAISHGDVLRLKRGQYCLAPHYRRTPLHPFVVAGVLHYPSHISLESALHHHGLIPEAVYLVSSVTSQRSRSYATPLGHFSFRRVPATNPRAGVKAIRVEPEGWVFLASPLRAIANLVYLRTSVRWELDGLRFLEESMRIEADDLLELPTDDVAEVRESIRNKRVGAYLDGLAQAVGR